jgi:CheY-like chemotaxis protein
MHGSLEVESQVDEGSTFRLTVPLPCDDTAPSSAQLAPVTLTGLRALVVDDHAVNRRVLEEQVASLGLAATSVAGGEAALGELRRARAAGSPYHVGLLDYQMPGMDGAELAGAIRRDPELGRPVLLLLTSCSLRDETSARVAGAVTSILLKPIRLSQLARALAAGWSERGAPPPPPPDPIAAAEGVGREVALPSAAGSADAHPAKRAQGATILVAEDNPVNQRVIERMLERFACVVEVARDGREAVERAVARRYDLIFMDCEMPELDGFAAVAQIRGRLDPSLVPPIVALTASATQGYREQCLAAGMDDYVSKPTKAAEIRAVLVRWLPPRLGASLPVSL